MKTSEKIAKKQRQLFFIGIALILGVVGFLIFSTSEESEERPFSESRGKVNVVSEEVNPEIMRLSSLEHQNDALLERLQSLEGSLQEMEEEQEKVENAKKNFAGETKKLIEKIETLEKEIKKPVPLPFTPPPSKIKEKNLKIWGNERKDGRHVTFEIPAGTVLKAVLV